MRISILTLFPEMFDGYLNSSIIKRAVSKDVVSFDIINIRDFTLDKNKRVDSAPIGGGAGLIMKCQPIIDAINSVKTPNSKVIMLSPRGRTYNQNIAHEIKDSVEHLILLCGHYEGIDERVINYIDEEISIGDFILTGGELASLVIADSVTRLLEGAITSESTDEESFENGLLEYPQYTEPFDYNGYKVPDILYSGNHEAIKKWRQKQSLKLTKEKRKDLFDKYTLTKIDKKLLIELESKETPKWESEAIKKGHKFIK